MSVVPFRNSRAERLQKACRTAYAIGNACTRCEKARAVHIRAVAVIDFLRAG